MTTPPHSLAILGCGGIGTMHASAAARANLPLAGFCDLNLDRAQSLAKEHNCNFYTDNPTTLLQNPNITAIVIATPNHLHREHALLALAAHKDLLLEKPMALTVAQCDDIIEAANQSDRIVQIGFVTRFAPAVQKLEALIEQGTLGHIYHAKALMHRQRGIPGLGSWFTTQSKSGGGVLIDLGVHLIDLVLHLTGRPQPTHLTASCRNNFGSPLADYRYQEMWAGPPQLNGICDVEDSAVALIQFENNLTLDLSVSWANNLPDSILPEGIILLGDQGACHLDAWNNTLRLTTLKGGLPEEKTITIKSQNPWNDAWTNQHQSFAQCCRNRTANFPGAATPTHGRETQAILEAIYRENDDAGGTALRAVPR